MNALTSEPAAGTRAPDFDALPDSTVSPVPRRLWHVVGALLAGASLLWGTFSVINVLAHEMSVETSTYALDEVTGLDIRSDNGSVTVVAGSGDSIEVRTEISEGLGSTKATERIASGILELHGECPSFESVWCSVDYFVEIPADRAVTIDVDNGSIVVRGVTGDVDVDNDNGGIELDDIGGNISVTNDKRPDRRNGPLGIGRARRERQRPDRADLRGTPGLREGDKWEREHRCGRTRC